MARRVEFKVSFVLPPRATVTEARAYVLDAISTMKGCRMPPGADDEFPEGDPIFGLDSDTIKVTQIRSK